MAAARAAGLTESIEVDLPVDDASAWTVAQTDRTWPVHYDKIAYDPASDTITARVRWADWPVLAKLSKLGVQAHLGYLFGLPNQLLLGALALGLLCVIVWAYRMWWQRRPTRAGRDALVGSPPERGTWRQLHPALLVGLLIGTAAVGWALPELGVSLGAFLLIDLTAGAVHRRRRRSAAPTSPAARG